MNFRIEISFFYLNNIERMLAQKLIQRTQYGNETKTAS